jgi:hypothetical protein
MDPTNLSANLRAVLLLLAAVVVAAILVLLRRLAFRWLIRPIGRGIGAVFSRLRFLLRLGRRAPPKRKPVKSLTGLSVGAIAEAFTETDDAIAEGFVKESVTIERHPRFACVWITPTHVQDVTNDTAEDDFEKAKHLFTAAVPAATNALNLYDDIHNAFIVRLFNQSDNVCFYILSEFRKVINSNVSVLAGICSLIVSLVAVANVTVSSWIDFNHILTLDKVPAIADGFIFLGIGGEEINKAIFGLASCTLGFGLMWLFYHMAYDQAQTHNGREMDKLLVGYLADISSNFNKIHGSAMQAVVGDTDVEAMKRQTTLWIATLHWMAFRVFFIEEFLRSILFQVRRNSIYSLFLVPAFFLALMIATAYVFGIHQLDITDINSNIYRQNSFYLAFPLLLHVYYKYLIESLNPMSKSIEGKWKKFRDLNVLEALAKIMEAYAVQLDQWRSRYKQGPGGQ